MAFQTMGKGVSVVYVIRKLKYYGLSIEARKADFPKDVRLDISISENADLMKGLSEKDEAVICPTANLAGNFDEIPVRMILSHCAELSQAALEENGKIVVYSKPHRASDREGKVRRRELSLPECEITKDTVSFFVDRPGLYTASMKYDMCEGKRVGLLAFLPPCMPKNKRPCLHVTFYYPFGEMGKVIRKSCEDKDHVCVADETTFILRHIGQDAEVTCEMPSLKGNPRPLKSVLDAQTMDNDTVKFLEFELDQTHQETNEVTIKLRVFQEECMAEINIRQTLEDPQSDEPEQIAVKLEEQRTQVEPAPPVDSPSFNLRIPKRVSDRMIAAISGQKIHADQLSVLVNALGFSTKDFGRFVSDNISSAGSRKGYAGTKTLLTRWRNITDVAHQRPELREAFKRSNLTGLRKRYLKVQSDFLD